jgi:hypothetical protein
VTGLLRRALLAMECDDRSATRALVSAGPVPACAALGSVVGHVVTTLVRDRRLLAAVLDDRVRTSS